MPSFSENKVDILMSTFNGARHLQAQLDSIVHQTETSWKLYIRDDGSTDETIAVIKEWCGIDRRIQLVDDKHGNLGPANSFLCLLDNVRAPVFFFADQDDIWLPNKLKFFSRICTTLKESKPALCFGDPCLINSVGDLISKSFHATQRFKIPQDMKFPRMLLQNPIVGCASAGNYRLAEILRTTFSLNTNAVIMHDWMAALVALALGQLIYIGDASTLYRQHGNNHLGAKGGGAITLLRQQGKLEKAQAHLDVCQLQAAEFISLFQEMVPPEMMALLLQFANENKPHHFWSLSKCFLSGIHMSTTTRNLGLLAGCIYRAISGISIAQLK